MHTIIKGVIDVKKVMLLSIFILLIAVIAGCKKNSVIQKRETLSNGEENAYVKEDSSYEYVLTSRKEVIGRQGIAYNDDVFYVSSNSTLTSYNKNWQIINGTETALDKIDLDVNHIGDIEVYNDEIYAGVEYFSGRVIKNPLIAVYDIHTFKLNRIYNIDPSSGQTEISGVTIDPKTNSIWASSWIDGESSKYLYRYSLDTGKYLAKYELKNPPLCVQGISYFDGYIYLTADDSYDKADHIYRVKPDINKKVFDVELEKTLDGLNFVAELEGLTFDTRNRRLLLISNIDSQLLSSSSYPNNIEMHEVFIYNIV